MKNKFSFLIFLLGIQTCFAFYQNCPTPIAEVNQNFCSSTILGNIGLTSETLEDLKVCGENLTWYSDAAGTNILPSTTSLTNGVSYYVSQTINNCESALLTINVNVKDCACIKNPDFENQSGQEDLSGYTFQDIDRNPLASACNAPHSNWNLISAGQKNSLNNAVVVNQGNDPILSAFGVSLPRTSPLGNCSTHAIRINSDTISRKKITSIEKNILLGKSLSLDFAFITSAKTNHSDKSTPFFIVEMFKEFNSGGLLLLDKRCILFNKEICAFNEKIVSSSNSIFYSDWSSLVLDTSEFKGTPVKLRISVADCSFGGHYGYSYVDNIEVTNQPINSSSIDFGNIAFSSLSSTGELTYENCSLLPSVSSPPIDNCSPKEILKNPTFPISFCTEFNPPEGGTLNNVSINLYNPIDEITASITNYSLSSPNKLCFDITQNDLTTKSLWGLSELKIEIEYSLNCDIHTAYHTIQKSINLIEFKPIAACPVPALTGCVYPPTKKTFFNLKESHSSIGANYDLSVTNLSFHKSISDALSRINEVGGTSGAYSLDENDDPYLYARLNWAGSYKGYENAFDIVKLDLIRNERPNIPQPEDIAPLINYNSNPNFDLTKKANFILGNLTDMNISYFLNENDAFEDTNPIVNPRSFNSIERSIYVRVENINTNCFSLTSFELEIEQTAGTSDVSDLTVSLFPNPTKNILHIESNSNIENITIYDLNGKQKEVNYKKTNNNYNVKVSSLSSGVYFLILKKQDIKTVKKFIKK